MFRAAPLHFAGAVGATALSAAWQRGGTYLLAAADIQPGDELLWDYGGAYWHERGWSYALDVADDDLDLSSPSARAERCGAALRA